MPGYDHPLLILPFDHRSSFTKKLFSFERPLTTMEHKKVLEAKEIIFEAFMEVYEKYPCQEQLGILVDEEFGFHLLEEANHLNIITATPVEKSGQKVFTFEFGNRFGTHLSHINPTFAKALVRYHPENKKDNQTQLKRLKRLSSYCQKNGLYLMLELLLSLEGERKITSKKQAQLVSQSISQMQDAGIEPDIWKIEAYASQTDWKKVLKQIRNIPERRHVSAIVLGRGEDTKQVKQWIQTASGMQGVVGFAIGRTIFFDPLRKYIQNKQTKKETVLEIAKRYVSFIKLWTNRVC